jgi:signal transduction histidine kinase
MKARWRGGWSYALAAGWLTLTVALAGWWLVFGLTQADQLARPLAERTIDVERVRRMLISEGGVLLALLVAGGVALLAGIRYEQRRQAAVESFFMAFTHELKTSLARVQLQAESLQEETHAPSPALERLLADALRLQLQLENSLFFAQPDGRLWLQRLSAREQVSRVAADFPALAVNVSGDAFISGDSRAIQSVLRNVLHNAVAHGGATAVDVAITRIARSRVGVRLADNGTGAAPEAARTIGAPFVPGKSSGYAGFGLFVSGKLVSRMHGGLRWSATGGPGFVVELDLPERDE